MLVAEALLFYNIFAATVAVSFFFHDAKAVSGMIAVLETLLAK